MPNILFASNNISHFVGASIGADTDRYDALRVPYSIRLSNFQEVSSPEFEPTTTDETWFHFRVHWSDINSSTTKPLLAAYDASNVELFTVGKPSSSTTLPRLTLTDGTSTVDVDGTLSLADDLVSFVDVMFKQNTTTIECTVYINGAISATSSFNSNPNSHGHPIRFQLGTAYVTSATSEVDFSEIMVADGDTRNARMDMLRPIAAGAYEEWDGLLATLADDDSTSGLTTVSADQRETLALDTYTGAANISNFVTVSTTTRGINSPSQMQHTVRSSGVDYDGALLDVDFAYAYQLTDFTVNPATSAAWTDSDLSSIEVGFVSRA